MNTGVIAHCGHCGGTWPVFETAAPPDTPPLGVADVQVTEDGLVDEAIGQEVSRINNSGPASAVRRMKVTRRWTRHIEFDDDHTKTWSDGVELKLADLAGFKSSAETTLRRRIAGGEETEQIFEEEIELSIPPYTTLELVKHWRRIWQEGVVTGVVPAGITIQIPFRAVVGLTFDFDQVTRQLANLPDERRQS